MIRSINKKYFSVGILSLILVGVVLPVYFARAEPSPDTGCGFSHPSLCLIDLTLAPIYAVGRGISWVADMLTKFIKPETQESLLNFPAVKDSWAMVRNFTNLFFILILIIIAFATIFDIEKYSWRQLLAPLIIVAVLINFSFVIAQYVISIANGLAAVFAKTMANQDIGVRLAQGLSLQRFFTINGGDVAFSYNAITAGTSVIAALIFILIFSVIALFALLTAFGFILIRVPALWLLLILSPLAAITSVLPYTQDFWKSWKKRFIAWSFFLPIYLFFLMFAFIFIAQKPTTPIIPTGASTANIFASIFSINDIFFYVITIMFMVYGLKIAMDIGNSMDSTMGMIAGGIQSGVRKYFPGSRYARSVYEGAKEGLKAKGEEYKERGALRVPGTNFKLFGGEQEARLRQAKVAQISSFGALEGQLDKAKLTEANKEIEKIRQAIQAMDPVAREGYLRGEMAKSGPRGNAALLELGKQGHSDLEDYKNAIDKFGGEYTSLGREYLKNIKEAKYSKLFESTDDEVKMARGDTDKGTIKYSELRRSLAQDLAEKNRITSEADYMELKKLFGETPKELRLFMNAIKPEFIYGDRKSRQAALLREDGILRSDSDLARKLIDYMKEKKEISAQRNEDGSIIEGSDVDIRNAVLNIVGESTIEGRNIINEIDKFNPVINIKADPKYNTDTARRDKIIKELAGKGPEDIAKYSVDLFEDKNAKDAIKELISQGTWDDDFLTQVNNRASGQIKKALKDIKGGTTSRIILPPGAGTGPTIGPEQSQTSDGTNVVDLRRVK